MEVQIASVNTQISPASHKYITGKFRKLTKHLPDIIDIKIEVTEEDTKSREQRYLVRANVNSGIGKAAFHGEERAEDLFKAVDKLSSVLTRQLEKHKGKLYHRGRGNPLARGKFSKSRNKESSPSIVKTKRFKVTPMSPEEAIEQMESLGHSFFLFIDAKSGEVQLIYRRNDGNYGIIQPELVK